MPKFRSPNYPAIGLKEAVERIGKMFSAEHQTPVPEAVAAKAIGYQGISGPARTTLSALRKYGLLEEATGGVRVASLAMEILYARHEAEKQAALRKAALGPEIFRELAANYLEASDTAIRAHLVRMGFSEDAATRTIKSFRETAQFANLSPEPVIFGVSEETAEVLKGVPVTVQSPTQRRPPAETLTEEPAAFVWPLPKGRRAELRISGGRFTRADLALLKQYLALAEMTVSDEEPAPNENPVSNAPEWQKNPTPSVFVGRPGEIVEPGSGPPSVSIPKF